MSETPTALRVRAIDLFCGAGGSSWGARLAGVEIVAAFDLWPLAASVHKANFPDAKFYPRPLEDYEPATLRKEIGKVDLILASPECTSHSPAKGNKNRCEKSKNTAFEVIRFAKAFQPRWLVIENVVSMKRWDRYAEFKAALKELGYKVREQVLNSVDFRVPQGRRRLFLLCDRKRTPEAVPKLPGRKPTASSFVNLNGAYKWTPLQSNRRAQATLDRAERAFKVIGKLKPFLLVYYGNDGAGGWQKLNRPLRTITTLDRFAVVKPSPDGHQMRMLQVPELKIAMGMDGMNFDYGSRRDQIKMLGNAVSPPVMRHIIKTLLFESR